jgi:hypothetical protein
VRAAPAGRLGLVAALLATAPAWALALHPHLDVRALFDGETHLLRSFFLEELIAAGELYPRWFPQQYGGYGYPTLTYYAPLTYYLLLTLAALPVIGIYESFQLLSAGAGAALVAGVYALAWRLWRHAPAAFLAAALTAYAPFVLPDNLYRAGALPRVIGLALAAWLLTACVALWQAARVRRRVAPRWVLLASLTAALLLTHNVTALMTALIAGVVLLCLWLARPSTRALLVAASAPLAGAAASAFFWLPALRDTGLVQTERLHSGNLHYRNHFLIWPGFHPAQWGEPARSVWTPGWPVDLHLLFAYSSAGPPKLALWQAVALVSAALLLAAAVYRRVYQRRARACVPSGDAPPTPGSVRSAYAAGVGGLILVAATYAQQFDWALPLWERYALLRSIQLPSRLLAFTGLGAALAAGSTLALWRRPGRAAWALAVGLTTFCAVASMAQLPVPLDPQRSQGVDWAAAIANERANPGSTVSTHEFLPRTAFFEQRHAGDVRGFWLYERLFPEAAWLAGRVLPWSGDVALRALYGDALWTVVDVSSPLGGTLAFHQLAFPGWRAWLDGRDTPLRPVPWIDAQAIRPGFILVDVPAGTHRVAIRFGGSEPRPSEATQLARMSVVEEVLAGRARIGSPSGAALGPDRFVDVRFLSLLAQDRPLRDAGARARRWLYTHPPADIEVDTRVPPGGLFQTGIALDPRTWEAPLGDGVEVSVMLTPRGGQPVALLKETLNPRARGEQRRWIDLVADLRPWAGQNVRLTLRSEGRQEPSNDWVGWAEPAVIRVDPLTAERLLRSTQETRKVALS